MSLVSLDDRLRAQERLDLRDALRDAITAADADFAGLYVGDRLADFAGDRDFAPSHTVRAHRSIPEVKAVVTSSGRDARETAAVVMCVRLGPYDAPMTLVLVGHEAHDVVAIDAVERANLRVERILAAVADRPA